ncbi:hypothetical protein SPRG_07537 [Saprolegnia parasitica CBS 223.65]|uniref:glucan endo-1,3-beta-D-glucosidase n=1 Tax=Saprolegnia parasitica (strain CBS 223.65) TaxID=695850 RepID=A0A067C9Y0_SAPPC|nr:hypothetical protein SPRG_07537 [Saprolegnia parasitica CBS 223.65]KDO27288.1 hypothetical protein SPRG_07537 [Saprolegnia parasitica CBS 223.65]|eukprot:XP_012202063.1 hypothetical protein SPRG_07537 [Saprolegnia parasitica CBS 223.65]
MRTWCFLALLVGVTATNSTRHLATVGQCSSAEDNVDYWGNDVAGQAVGSASACCDLCGANNQCAISVYTGGMCYLKSGRGARSTKQGAVALPKPSSPYPTEANTDYWGNDFDAKTATSVGECATYCAANSQCVVSVLTGSTCYLKNKLGAKSVNNGATAIRVGGNTATSCTQQANTDYYGNDIGSTKPSSASGCCADCAANAQCLVAVYTGGTCWLKNKVGGSSYNNGAVAVFSGRAPVPATGGSSVPFQNLKAQYKYPIKGGGTYNMVTNYQSCARQSQRSDSSIGPLSEQVSMIFRGPMYIFGISVFQPSGGNWNRVSSWTPQQSNNLVFMNNLNPNKYNNQPPQGYAQADGMGFSETPVQFGGWLRDASDPSNIFGGPGIATGAEVNIMQPSKCSATGGCLGVFDQKYGLNGWGGSKIFVVKAIMYGSGLPAIWMLNAQVMRANQYGCNCRGMADPGGCGELDIAEAIPNGGNNLATHYYYLNTHPSPGHDTWTTRPTSRAATFVTILDEASGTIKVMHFTDDDYDKFFDTNALSNDAVNAMISR